MGKGLRTRGNALEGIVIALTRIIHQPGKAASESTCGVKMSPTSTVLQGHSTLHTKLIRSPWYPPNRPQGRDQAHCILAALRGLQQPLRHCTRPSMQACRACQVKRRHANKITLRLNTGATGHDEGSEILMRSVHSGTRAPSLSQRSWMVSIVARAHGVPFNTSRRRVSSNT
jgi:hypothetical protein